MSMGGLVCIKDNGELEVITWSWSSIVEKCHTVSSFSCISKQLCVCRNDAQIRVYGIAFIMLCSLI